MKLIWYRINKASMDSSDRCTAKPRCIAFSIVWFLR